MYQVNIAYEDATGFDKALADLQERMEREQPSCVLFHVFNASNQLDDVHAIVNAIRARFPQAPYVGATSNANIADGALVTGDSKVVVVCDVFEKPDTGVEIMHLPLDYENQKAAAQALLEALEERPDVKAVEMITTVLDVNTYQLCSEVSAVREDIILFGGGAVSPSTDFEDVVVFSSEGPIHAHGIVFVLYSGKDFHAKTQVLQGWKPLGMPFRVTRAEKARIYELNGVSAYDTYHHYLNIPADEKFAWNGLVFPLSFDYSGMQVLRTPMASLPDGSLLVPADISDETNECRIAYGDPSTILESVMKCADAMRQFRPQAILAFSCAARFAYWGEEFVSGETLPLQDIAPTAGFYTGGEFVRHGAELIHHNMTLVVVGLREGELDSVPLREAPAGRKGPGFNLQMNIIHRMAYFIGAASKELKEAYDRLEEVARTDGLTNVANRREAERAIAEAIQRRSEAGNPGDDEGETRDVTLVMLDLDDFKSVNDTYGHEVGDEVLRSIARVACEVARQEWENATVGRWGGEEFMICIPECTLAEAERGAERLRKVFAGTEHSRAGFRTTSIGIAQMCSGETFDRLCSRVDDALYEAKGAGKNRVVLG